MHGLKSTREHICAWGRMRKYLRELESFLTSEAAIGMPREKRRKAYYDRERILAWILNAEKQIKIQFIPVEEEWGGHTGY